MSGYKFPILNRLTKKLSGGEGGDATTEGEEGSAATPVPSDAASSSADSKAEEDAAKEEKYLSSILEITRRLFYEMGIVGAIDVTRSVAIYSSSIHCEVDGTNMAAFEEELSAAQDAASTSKDGGSTMFERRVTDAVRGALSTLANRARAYRNKPYRSDLVLTCGITLSDPFLGVISTSVGCSATVTSLLEHKPIAKTVKV